MKAPLAVIVTAVIIHLLFAFAGVPEAGHLIWILDDKLPALSLPPGNDMVEPFLLQQLQDQGPWPDLPAAQGGL